MGLKEKHSIENGNYNLIFLKYNNSFIDKYNKKTFNIHYNKLSKITNVNDCIKLLQMFETTDEMCDNIINVFHEFNPSEDELQKFSLIFQDYHNNVDNKGFAASTMWFCVIQWINESQNLKNIN